MNDIYYHGPVVVFDLDDTLFAEREFCYSGFRYLLTEVPENERPPILEGMTETLRRRENSFEVYADSLYNPSVHGADREKWLKTKIEAYRSHKPESLSLWNDAKDLLDRLKHEGVRMALVTDGRSITQRRKIEALGLMEFIPEENIYISEEVGEDKHSPKSFVDLVRKYPEARAFYYIGDNERKDFTQPNLLGWTTVKIRHRDDNVHPDYENQDPIGRPVHIIDDLREAERIIFN